MENIKDKYRKASEEFVNQVKINKDVIGIIVSGSLIYSRIDKNSDIDIFVILKSGFTYRERGNVWINDVEIEYFKNPPNQIRNYFKKEIKSPHTAHMLAFGKLVYCSSEEVKKLIKEAKKIIDKQPPKLSHTQIELEKYLIDDQFKDLEDSIINDDEVASIIIRNKTINRCIDTFCNMHQIRRDKDKRLNQQIKTIDEIYLTSVNSALTEGWNKLNDIEKLRILTEELLGGRRSKEWILKSELDI